MKNCHGLKTVLSYRVDTRLIYFFQIKRYIVLTIFQNVGKFSKRSPCQTHSSFYFSVILWTRQM